MTVLEYAYDSKWIIAKSSSSRFGANYQYWIVDKGFNILQENESTLKIIKSQVYGPLDSIAFRVKLFSLNINLTLKKISPDE